MPRLIHIIALILTLCTGYFPVEAQGRLILPKWEAEKSDFYELKIDDKEAYTVSFNEQDSYYIKTIETGTNNDYSLNLSFCVTSLHSHPYVKYDQYYRNKDGKIVKGEKISRPIYGWVVGMKDDKHFNAVWFRSPNIEDEIYSDLDIEFCVVTVDGNDTTYHTEWNTCHFDNLTNSEAANPIWIHYKNNTLRVGDGWFHSIPWDIVYNLPALGSKTGLYLGGGSKVKIENILLVINEKEMPPRTHWNDELLTNYYMDNAQSLHPYEGFWEVKYESKNNSNIKMGGEYQLAIVANGDTLDIIYLSGAHILPNSWQEGCVKGRIIENISGLCDVVWYDAEGEAMRNIVINELNRSLLKLSFIDNNNKLYLSRCRNDISIPSNQLSATGSGFAIDSKGYIVTNFHVIEHANKIVVCANPADDNALRYNAVVVASDESNDLAIIRIVDDAFVSFGELPYGVSNRLCRRGESVFYMGYPLPSTLTTEIKNATGNITAQNGLKVSQYMISVDVDHGSSGSPLFDESGNVVGIVSSGMGYDVTKINANYAIKSSYLIKLAKEVDDIELNENSKIKGLSYPDQIEAIAPHVFLLEIYK